MTHKLYVYRVQHDENFAPHFEKDYCFLSGCKNSYKRCGFLVRNIEELAESGSWIIGIGGVKTTKPNSVLYIMEVRSNLSYKEFKDIFPEQSIYLGRRCKDRVLVSGVFRYLGDTDESLDLPENLKHLYVSGVGKKCSEISDKDIENLRLLCKKS